MTLEQGIEAAATVDPAFPIQVGLTFITDGTTETMEYQAAMTAAQTYGLGWLWWDWYNPGDGKNNLTKDGTIANLLAIGETVVHQHAGGLSHTATTACGLP